MRRHIHHFTRAARAAAVTLAVAAPIFLSPGAARAQTPQARRDERRLEMEERQRALRSLGDASKPRPSRHTPDRRPSYRQVAEDFEQLQVRSYQLSVAAESAARLAYEQIREEAAEIKKRASRLKSTLALPADAEERKQKKPDEASTPEELKAAIASLDALVKSFVWNPVFRQPNVLDAENSLKARRDLEEILRRSEQIKKCAEALGKGGGKNF